MSEKATYRFLPWARSGFLPSETDPLSGPVADPSEFTIRLTPEAESADGTVSPSTDETIDVRMYGPGDVLGFDHRQVVRVEPTPKTTDFEPNYFPMVEFDRPFLPWLFSPAAATAEGKLRPWLCLVVIRKQSGVTLTTGTRRETPILEIGGTADPAVELPRLDESWAWAHVQVVGGPTTGADEAQWVTDQLRTISTDTDRGGLVPVESDTGIGGSETKSTQTVARLVAPRRLQPNESYHACIVPVFEPGRRAGLGLDPFPGTDDSRQIAPAWDHTDMPSEIRLPVYYAWEFGTGSAGDFEALVRRLDPTELTSVGFRTVDASDPGPDELAEHRPTDVRVEGALRSAGLDHLPYPSGARQTLAEFLGQVDVTGDNPTFGPPVYGQRHAGVSALPERSADSGVPWLRELNVDPRHRIAAGYGTQVVQHEQEALMQSAWAQVGEVRRANRLLQRGQLAREVSCGIHADLTRLSPPEKLTVTAPMHRRVQGDDTQTVYADIDNSHVPTGTLTLSFQRLTRPGGPLGTRIASAASSTAPLSIDNVIGTFIPERTAELQGEDTSFQVETETPPDGTVTIETEDVSDPVKAYCEELTAQLGETGDPWPPVWVKRLDRDEFPVLSHTICEHAENVLKDFENSISDEATASELLSGVFQRLRRAWDCICTEGIKRYEQVPEDQHRQQVAVLTDLIDCCNDAITALDDLDGLLDADLAIDPDHRPQLLDVSEALAWLSYGLAILLRSLAYSHLQEDLCTLSKETLDDVTEAAEATPDAADDAVVAQLTGVYELLCGTNNEPGLLRKLDDLVDQNGSMRTHDVDAHRSLSRLVRELQRLIAVARDRSDQLAGASQEPVLGDAIAALPELYTDFAVLVDHVGNGIGAPADTVGTRMHAIVCGSDSSLSAAVPHKPLGGNVIPDLSEAIMVTVDPIDTVNTSITAHIGGLDAIREDTTPDDTGSEAATSDETEPEDTEPKDPLDPIMAAPTFPHPMYDSLRELDVEHFLPGVGAVPPDSLGLLETNPAFVEAYLVGLNHEMARELNWREYPTDRRGTYFKRFWDRRGAVPPPTGAALDDIDGIHTWPIENGATQLGDNLLGGGATSDAVLLVRGELLRRYPNTIIYVIEAERFDGKRQPIVTGKNAAPPPGTVGVEYPVFRGTIDPDITFLGFDISTEDLIGGTSVAPEGYFLVIEEAPGEPRLGLDEPVEGALDDDDDEFEWADLTWAHVAPDGDPDSLSYVPVPAGGPPDIPSPPTTPFEWGKNGAHMAGITWQKPVRIAIHASDVLPTIEENS